MFFNRTFVDAMNEVKSQDPNFIKFTNLDFIQEAKKSSRALGETTLDTDGSKICRIADHTRICWSPVFEKDRVGVLLEGKSSAFYPSKNKTETLKKLKSYLDDKNNVSLFDYLLPRANAARPSVENLQLNDQSLIFASMNGWQELDLSAKGQLRFLRNWVSSQRDWSDWSGTSKIDGKTIKCGADNNAEFSMGRPEGNLTVKKKGENSYILSASGLVFSVKLEMANDAKSCERETVRTEREVIGTYYQVYGSCDDEPKAKTNQTVEFDEAYAGGCYWVVRTCRYPLPKQYLSLKKCVAGLCNQDLTASDYQKVMGTEVKSLEKIEALRGELVKKSDLSGEAASLLFQYEKVYKRESKFAAESLRRDLVKTRQHVLAAEMASRCCQDVECKRKFYDNTGIDLTAPSQDPQKPVN